MAKCVLADLGNRDLSQLFLQKESAMLINLSKKLLNDCQ